MANAVLKPLTPLGHDAPETETVGPWTITEQVDVALASLACRKGRDKDVAKAAKGAKIPLPEAAQAVAGAPYGAFWLAEGQWMIEAPFESHEDIRSILLPIFGDAASITEQTDAWVRFQITGTDLPRLFERLSNLDLPKAAPGMVSRTVIEHLGCYLILRAEGEITLYGPRSSAQSLHHALITAAKAAL